MPPLPLEPSPDWIAAGVVLWLGAAGWVSAVAAHLGLPEWRWFGFAMLTGPVAWGVIAVRFRRERRRRRTSAAAREVPEGDEGPGAP